MQLRRRNKPYLTRWENPISDKKAINLDTMEFFFAQAEKKLESVLSTLDSIRNKGAVLLAIQIGIVSGFVPFIYSLSDKPEQQNLLPPTILTLFGLCIGMGLALLIFRPQRTDLLGSSPRDIVHLDFIEKKDKMQLSKILNSELHDYQNRIDDSIRLHEMNRNLLLGSIISTCLTVLAGTIWFGFKLF